MFRRLACFSEHNFSKLYLSGIEIIYEDEQAVIGHFSKLYLSGIEIIYEDEQAVIGHFSKLYLSGIEIAMYADHTTTSVCLQIVP